MIANLGIITRKAYVQSFGHLLAVISWLTLVTGCHTQRPLTDTGLSHYRAVATDIEYPDAHVTPAASVLETHPPHTIRRQEDIEYWPLTLAQVVQLTLANSQVIRDAGGRILLNPDLTSTVFDPAIQQTDPRFGPEAALSAFDAQFIHNILWNRDDFAFNNAFFGGGANTVSQTVAESTTQIAKTTATGTQFAARNITNYNRNNVPIPPNLFSSTYTTVFEVEARHPLLQGSGIGFNRIAGPGARPGFYNGVLVARINTDIALADLEITLRDHLAAVERAYWDLYFAYRNLDASLAGRAAAHEAWRSEEVRLTSGASDREQEALARQQLYFAEAQVENALSGTGLTTIGVYRAEQELRRLMGLPASDSRLIRPAEEPARVETVFPWDESLELALWRRPELRRQEWNIKRRELELQASRNFIQMRLDLVGRYRFRGFGDQLFGNDDVRNGSAFADLFDGDLQGWTTGFELSTPIGNRIGYTAVRNAELQLARARALHEEQQRHVSVELSGAFTELDRAYEVTRTNFNRTLAVIQQTEAVRDKYNAGMRGVVLEFVLNALQRATEAERDYYRTLVDYNLAVSSVHRARGTYLDYLGVELAEGPWVSAAHESARKEARRFRQRRMNYCLMQPATVSRGKYPQRILGPGIASAAESTEMVPATAAPDPDNIPRDLPEGDLPPESPRETSPFNPLQSPPVPPEPARLPEVAP